MAFADIALSRRGFLVATGGVAGALLLTSCGSPNSPTQSGGITTAGWNDGAGETINGPIREAFEKASGLKVTPQALVPFSDYQTRFRTLLAGGAPPSLMRLNDDFMREMSDKKTILDLNRYTRELDKSQYFENVFDFSDLPNGRAGLAVGTSPRVLFINKTMFEKKGVPLPPTTWTSDGWTWNDYLETAKALTGDGDYGTVLVKDTAFENTWSTNNGGEGIFSEDGRRFTLADSEGIEAMQWAADLALKHQVAPTWAEIAPDQEEQRMFASGRIGMFFSAMPVAGYLADNVTDFEWDIAPIPAKVNQYSEGSMVVMVIPEATSNPDDAWEFLKFITGEEGGTFFAERRTCVPLHRAAADALVSSSAGTAPENVQLFIDGADHNRSVNSTTATAAAVAIYRPQLQRALIGEISAKEALTSVRDQVEAELA